MDGRFLEGQKRHQESVVVERGPWRLILDKLVVSTQYGTTIYTRARTYYVAQDDFRLRVEKRTRLARLSGFYGPVVPTGDRDLDERCLIRSRHASRARSFFHDQDVRRLIKAQPDVTLEIKGLGWLRRRKLGSRARVVTTLETGVIAEHQRLVDRLELVGRSVEHLVGIGSATKEPFREGEHHGDIRRKL